MDEEDNLLAYRQQCNTRSVSMQLTEAKGDYYSTKIEASNNDQKSLFDIIQKNSNSTNFELANWFSKFFNDKIHTLKTSFRIDANSNVEIEPLATVKLNNQISDTSDEMLLSSTVSTHTGRWYPSPPPSNWHPGPLVDWWPPSIQPAGAPQIRDM